MVTAGAGMVDIVRRTSRRTTRTDVLAIGINGGRNMLDTRLHMHTFLEQVLPAFKWLTWWGFLLGLIESFLYGAYVGLVFCPIFNWLHRHLGVGRASG